MKYEMMETMMTQMVVQHQLIQLLTDMYAVVDPPLQQTNVNSELLDTIQMRIKINESIYEVMD